MYSRARVCVVLFTVVLFRCVCVCVCVHARVVLEVGARACGSLVYGVLDQVLIAIEERSGNHLDVRSRCVGQGELESMINDVLVCA
mmetsp:Transcript_10968/g.33817  ORF Transcript_10968/g.33817 Transcript_10968/m.33817 type:complete len:86 (+) Transcript_10968:382-639(+)